MNSNKKVVLAVFLFFVCFSIYNLLHIGEAFGNETYREFGDSSWQFKDPATRITQQNTLNSIELRKGRLPVGGGNSATGTGSGSGGSAIGNVITIVIDGDGNTVQLDSTQTNENSSQSTETVTLEPSDVTITNNVDASSETTVNTKEYHQHDTHVTKTHKESK